MMTHATIKALREKLNMSKEKFAEAVGVSLRTVQTWESKKHFHHPRRIAVEILKRMEEKAKDAA